MLRVCWQTGFEYDYNTCEDGLCLFDFYVNKLNCLGLHLKYIANRTILYKDLMT